MAWRCSGVSNADLVGRLFDAKIIQTDSVKRAMLADRPQTLGYNSTISAPHMHATALEGLAPFLFPGAKVLDVGSGSGYLTVCMAEMVGPEGKAVGVEHIPELVDLAKQNTAKNHKEYLDQGRVVYHTADGRVGFPQEAPYDCIHVGAAADSLYEELVGQLKAPGRMFIPVGGRDGQAIYVIDKDKDGRVTEKKTVDVWYVPLTDVGTQYSRR
ncbi:hypothetical protein BGZ54_007735 [Gamsiella multidivaricata]|nr:hypothetical protein BGZ54_007735 [Gamsiella multidivaricata]